MNYRNDPPTMTAREILELAMRRMQEATACPLCVVPPIFPRSITVRLLIWNDAPAIDRWEGEGGSCLEVDR
jgi:hypothetical protein